METKGDTIRIPVNYVSPKKRANIEKHMRIAKNTYGEEKMSHLKAADKLLTRYGLWLELLKNNSIKNLILEYLLEVSLNGGKGVII